MSSSQERSQERTQEEDFSHLEGPAPYTTLYEGKNWELDIKSGQQPIRARACGFGDKDRRPISPPPCVRLIIIDAKTGQEIDVNRLDLSFFVLTVDLWDLHCTREANLVRHSSASPAISTTSTAAYPRTGINPYNSMQAPQPYGNADTSIYTTQNYASPMSATPTSAMSYDHRGSYSSGYSNGNSSANYSPASQYISTDQRYGATLQNSNGYPQSIPAISSFHDQQTDYIRNQYGNSTNITISASTTGMYTRNLIGNLSASAFRLKDLNGKEGIWFVLQDLSVRTEGWFRLKFTFVNLHRPEHHPQPGEGASPLLEQGQSAPVLASVFSAPFHVWSAKRFPGVIESTPLSREFAAQGIKIPIRKEVKDDKKSKRKRGKSDGRDDDEDEDDEDDQD